jgi:dTDP-4-amino-4,6-dideoxygalactose transaminase
MWYLTAMKRYYTLFNPGLIRHGEAGKSVMAAIEHCLDGMEAALNCLPDTKNPVSGLSEEFAKFVSISGEAPRFVKDYCDDRKAVTLDLGVGCFASATLAIYLSLRASGIGDGEVITTSLNYMGVPNAIAMSGARPRFIDVDRDAFCMDLSALAKALDKKTRAIVLTHFNTLSTLEPIVYFYIKHGLEIPLIQDASLAIASARLGLKPGFLNLGEGGTTVISLAPSKIITGLGGAVATSQDVSHMNRMLSLANQGMSLADPMVLEETGLNAKMHEINAAIALNQFQKRRELFDQRKRLAGVYGDALAPLVNKGALRLQRLGEGDIPTHYALLIPRRDEIGRRLFKEHGIMIGAWHACHRQPSFKKGSAARLNLKVTDEIADQIAFLPFHPGISDSDVEYICKAIEEELS